jgi:PIN domain nuclease of toxin-antitoxin system
VAGLSESRVIVDTHVLLWMLTDPALLSTDARDALRPQRVEVYVSAATAWELSTKHRLGRLPQADVLLHAYDGHLKRLGAHDLKMTSAHARLAGSLDWQHRDPFDRMIAAQAMIESLALITADKAFNTVNGVRTLW